MWGTRTLSGQWTRQEAAWHINNLELEGAFRAIQQWAPLLQHHQVTLFSDNTTTVAYINRQGGTRSARLCRRTWDLLHLCRRWDILLRASHLAGKENVMADALSRGHLDGNEWCLNQVWADHVFHRFGKPLVDLFATHDNTRLPIFCTRRFHPEAWATDALSIPWDGLSAYAFPPFCLLNRVLQKLRNSTMDLLLIAPHWPNQHWFPTLLSMLVDLPLKLPSSRRLLLQRQGRVWHNDPSLLHLCAWELSSDVSKRQAFLRKLHRLQLMPVDPPQCAPITVDWPDSRSGHRTTMSIPWAHQFTNWQNSS